MPASLIAGGAGIIGGLIKGIVGGGQKKQGKKIIKQLGDEQVPQELIANQRDSAAMANQGLPSEQYQMAMRNIQRQQLNALRGANDRRGGLAAISALQQGTNDATLGLDSENAQQRIANQRYAMGVNNQVGMFKHNMWERKYNYGMGLLGMGNQNLTGGIDQLFGGVGQGAYGAYKSGLFGGGKKIGNTGDLMGGDPANG